MISRWKRYPAQIKIVFALLVLEFLIPFLWFLLGAFLPTIPFIAFGILCWLAVTGVLSLLGVVGIILRHNWGKIFALLSLLWLLATTFLLLVLEIIRFFVTDYPDPILYSVAEAVIFLSVLTLCVLGVVWLLGKHGNIISSQRVSEY
jgi:hypothetical protein